MYVKRQKNISTRSILISSIRPNILKKIRAQFAFRTWAQIPGDGPGLEVEDEVRPAAGATGLFAWPLEPNFLSRPKQQPSGPTELASHPRPPLGLWLSVSLVSPPLSRPILPLPAAGRLSPSPPMSLSRRPAAARPENRLGARLLGGRSARAGQGVAAVLGSRTGPGPRARPRGGLRRAAAGAWGRQQACREQPAVWHGRPSAGSKVHFNDYQVMLL